MTRRGMEFYEKAQELVKGFDVFKTSMPILRKKKMNFPLLASTMTSCHQLFTAFSDVILTIRTSVFLNQHTVQILDEVAQGHSEIGIIYLNNQNKKGIMQRVEKLGLEGH